MSATGDNLSKKVHILFKVEQDTELVVVDNPVVLMMFISNTLFSFGDIFCFFVRKRVLDVSG